MIAWSINKLLAGKSLVSSPWNGRITAKPFGGRRAIRRHFVSTVRILSLRECTLGHKHRPHYHLERASKLFSCSYQLTGTRSGYFLRIFSPSDLRFSNACSSLYCHFIFAWKFSFKITNFRYLRPSFHFCDHSVKDATNCACPKQMKTLESHDLTSSFAMASERFINQRWTYG